jgi:hypothetical protein
MKFIQKIGLGIFFAALIFSTSLLWMGQYRRPCGVLKLENGPEQGRITDIPFLT